MSCVARSDVNPHSELEKYLRARPTKIVVRDHEQSCSKLNQIEAHDVGNHNTNQSKLNIFSGANWKAVLWVQIEIAVRSHLSVAY